LKDRRERELPHVTHASSRRLAPFLDTHTAPSLDRGGGVVDRMLRAAGRVHRQREGEGEIRRETVRRPSASTSTTFILNLPCFRACSRP
jgi:hypothetical protein